MGVVGFSVVGGGCRVSRVGARGSALGDFEDLGESFEDTLRDGFQQRWIRP